MTYDLSHDGGQDPLPEPELPPEGTPVVLTQTTKASDEQARFEVLLPPGLEVTYRGDVDEGFIEVTYAVIVHAYITPDGFRVPDKGAHR